MRTVLIVVAILALMVRVLIIGCGKKQKRRTDAEDAIARLQKK